MKAYVVAAIVALLLSTGALTAAASTTTTPASGGTNLSADKAQNGAASAFTALGNVVITEGANNDFRTSGTLILTAPSGWQFNGASGVTVKAGKVGGGGPSELSATVGAVTASSITLNITVNAVGQLDVLTVSGIEAQSVEGGNLPASANILRTAANPGTAVIVGVSNDVTNFGSLSQAIGALRLHVVLPGQSFTDGSTVAASGTSGAPANQAAGAAFNLAKLVAADREFNVATTYSGSKTIAYAGPGGSPSYTTNVSFTAGNSTTALATTLRKAETTTLSATSATSPAIATAQPSSSLTVDAGAVVKLQLLLPGETAAPGTATGKSGTPTAQTIGAAILNNVRVNAVDANWNVVGSSIPDVAISSSDVAAAIADDNGGVSGNLSLVAGSGTLSSFTFGTVAASQTLTATDVAAALSAGPSASVTVNKVVSATGLVSSQNPAVFGQSVTFTATVTGGAGTPTGTVNFKDGATVIANAVALDGSGQATFTTSSLTAATHTISAVYSGSALYSTSTSANLSQVVGKGNTTTSLVSSLNPSCAGSPVTLTATVAAVAPGAGVPTGSVDFKDGATVIGTVALNVSGVAALTTSSLSVATHNLTAAYKGSGSFNVSTSTPVLVQAVKAKPTASVSGSAAICPGGSATIRANLTGAGPWTVTWSDGAVQSGVAVSPATRSVSPAATTVYTVTNVADVNCSSAGTGSAAVTVNALPAITTQPVAKNVCAGSTATFTVAATGTGLTYQWQKDGVNLVNGGRFSGATGTTLTISSTTAADAGSYYVQVSGTCPPSLYSDAASLTVRPVPVATITAASLICAGASGNSASVADAGPGVSYAWSINNGTITGGTGTATITYTAGASGSSMTLNVTVTSPNGCSASSSKIASLSTGSVEFQDWKNTPYTDAAWQNSTLSAKEMLYPEGGTVPFRIRMPQPCVGTAWSITLQYDFADNSTGVHFVDFLTTYNAFEASVNGHASDGGASASESTFPIPSDPALAYQLPGVFTVENGTITNASVYTTDVSGGVTRKYITLTGTATPGAEVMLLFGAHIARDFEWGTDKGARQWPTGTASIGYVNYLGIAGHTNIKISDSILDNPSVSDVSIVATDTPDPVAAGHNLAYSITVYNNGPLAAGPDTISNAIPAGTTFVSATAPAGWSLSAPAVGGTGAVQWILPTSIGPAGTASFGMVVAVDAGASGTVENTFTLASGSADAYQTNNVSHVSTTILAVCVPPTVAGDPVGATACLGDTATFSASATGIPAPAIQWQVMPAGGGSFSDVVGETSGSLRVAATVAQAGSQYRARFENACGTAYSEAATLDWCPGNNAPVVAIVSPANGVSIAVGVSVTFAGTFTDDAGDTHTAVWTIGGVEVPAVVDDSAKTVVAKYAFTTTGTFSIKLAVTDEKGAVGICTQMGGQDANVIVYNAGGGAEPTHTPRRDPDDLYARAGMEFNLAQNAPNPFSNGTQIHFSLPTQSRVKIGVFDIAGRQVASLSNQVWEPGSHALSWSGRSDAGTLAPGGMYVVRMIAESTTGSGHYSAQKTMIRIN